MRAGLPILVAVSALLLAQIKAPVKNDEQLWRYRNRGKAYYENPTTQLQAIEEFRKALTLAPNSPRDRLNYALALFRGGKTDEGVAELKKVQAADPKLPHTWFNLGIHYKKQGEAEQASAMFEKMIQLAPNDAVSHYNLAVLYKLQNKLPQAQALFEKAAQLGPSLAAPHFQLYNTFRLAGQREEAAKQLAIFQELKKAQEASGNTEDMEWNEYAEIYDPIDPAVQAAQLIAAQMPKFTERKLAGTIGADRAGMLVFDVEADGRPDLLVWSASSGGLLFARGASPVQATVLREGQFFAAADVDNDGFPDLVMLTAAGAQLIRNRKGVLGSEAEMLAPGSFQTAVWLDYDHDYDLDLLLFGSKPALLRNQGEAGFADRTSDFPFVSGSPVAAIAYRTVPDTKGVDVLVTYSDRASVLYRDQLAGKFRAEPSNVPQGATHLQAYDWNRDSVFDVTYVHGGKLNVAPSITGPYVFLDAGNTGSPRLYAQPAFAMATADFNSDGRMDVAMGSERGIVVQENVTPSVSRFFSVRLVGVKNQKLAPGAEVEVRSGRQYLKQRYDGVPLIFAMAAPIDAVRITWPNGLIQNETVPITGRAVEYKEAPRLSGSCPMIYTWDGKEFRFLTDVLGVAPLGASSGDGQYFPADHDEYVFIPGDVLKPRNGSYELRITEELSEVTYLDQLKLMAVDHPAEVEVFTNDKWKSPPFPEFRLFTSHRRFPARLAAVERRDQQYAGPKVRTMQGTAETFALEIDFGPQAPSESAVLVLNGWVDWADGSAFRNRAQQPGQELTPPYLQVRDASGKWQTVIEDMGIPSGKTKTIAVDMSGKFLSASREVRIVTNMCVYWDEVFLAVHETAPTKLHTSSLAQADLGFHGFSQVEIDAQRRKPEHFLYQRTLGEAPWNPTPGLYTRYGDVRELLDAPDDQFVIMGAGDELVLRFRELQPPPTGWKRDFLLYVDGWAKDSDANTSFSQTVEPLPFHGMSQYPYPAGEQYPSRKAYTDYRKRYNTRPAATLVKQVAP